MIANLVGVALVFAALTVLDLKSVLKKQLRRDKILYFALMGLALAAGVATSAGLKLGGLL